VKGENGKIKIFHGNMNVIGGKGMESEKEKAKSSNVAFGVIIFLVLIGVIVWWIWPRGPATVNATIQISSNTSWSGSIGADGQSTSVEGFGSKSFTVHGSVFSAVVQKQTEEGYLTVSIIVNGETKTSQTTTAAYGVVTVSWSS
jgi:hypothetical protein